jgi:two-component system, NtrC family, sensor kinase
MDPMNSKVEPYYRSLTRNIIGTIIVVSIIPMILVSSTLYLQFRNSYQAKVRDHLRELVQKHRQNIDRFLNERLSDIQTMATVHGYDKLCDQSYLEYLLEVYQRNTDHAFVDLGVINAAGKQVAYAGPFKLARAEYSDAAWFRMAMQRQMVISDVFLGLRGLPHFIVAVRQSVNGNRWLLRATIDFAAFNTLVENIQLGKTGFAFILNQTGQMQTTPLARSSQEFVPDNTLYDKILEFSPATPKDKVRIAIIKDSASVETIYAAAFLKNGEWLLVFKQNAADAFADLNRTFYITTIIMLIGPLSVVIMAIMLSKRIVERIARADQEKQLMNETVIETGKLASVGELAAGVAHEINNPVAIMVEEAGWIGDLLEEEEFKPSENLTEFRRALAQIRTQGQRCKEITQKLLSFARKTDSTVRDINLNQLLEEIITLSAQRAKYAIVEVHKHLEENLPSVRLAPSELQQVFLNLINNAIDAMEPAGGTLTIRSTLRDAHIVIEVSDTGPGIPEANLHRIFDPFFTTKPVGKGTGLGLSICYGIIHKIGGKIEVKSSVGTGTTFSVYLPVATHTHPVDSFRDN